MKACLLVHGFTGSPYEIQPLAEALRRHDYVVELPVLAGHGIDEDLQDVYWTDWIDSAETVLQKMVGEYEEINIIGFSMGSLIATYLSTVYPVAKLVLISPAIYYIQYRQLFENMSKAIRDKFMESLDDDVKEYIRHTTNTPMKSIIGFHSLSKELTPYLAKVTVPTLILQGRQDLVVDPESAKRAYDMIETQEKQLLFLDKSPHIMCYGEESEDVNQFVVDFLQA